MKILHVMKDYKPGTGGSVIRNSSIIDNYEKYFNDEITIINLDGKKHKKVDRLQNIDIYRSSTLLDMFFYMLKQIRKNDFEIIHSHNFRFYFISYICKKISFKNPKIIIELHALYKMNRWKEKISYYLLKKADKIIVLSEGAKIYLVENEKIDENKIEVVRNGLKKIQGYAKSQSNELSNKFVVPEDSIVLGYIGSFFDWQGVNFIAENIESLLSKYKYVYLLMVGDGPEHGNVVKTIDNYIDKDRVIIIKKIEHKDIISAYNIIDIFLIPRLKTLATETAVPLKLVEAMQLAKPIIASNVKGLTELLNENNAIIFKPNSKEQFIEFTEMLIIDDKLRKKIGDNAKKSINKELLSWKSSVSKLNKIYIDLIKE